MKTIVLFMLALTLSLSVTAINLNAIGFKIVEGKDSLTLAEVLSLDLLQMDDEEIDMLSENVKSISTEQDMEILAKRMEEIVNLASNYSFDVDNSPEVKFAFLVFITINYTLAFTDSSECYFKGNDITYSSGGFGLRLRRTSNEIFKVSNIIMGPENKRIQTLVVERISEK